MTPNGNKTDGSGGASVRPAGFSPLEALYFGPAVRCGADGKHLEAGALVFAVAFSARDTLASTSGIDSNTAPIDVPEFVRPSVAATRTLRGLDQLCLPLALFGDLPLTLLKGVADALWFPGQLAHGADPLTAVPIALNLPASCIWFVTADFDEAQRAGSAGFTVVHLAPGAQTAIDAPDNRGMYVLNAIDDLLEPIRTPYTRSALSLRSVIGAVLYASASSAPTP
jgi:hypothetical protein